MRTVTYAQERDGMMYYGVIDNRTATVHPAMFYNAKGAQDYADYLDGLRLPLRLFATKKPVANARHKTKSVILNALKKRLLHLDYQMKMEKLEVSWHWQHADPGSQYGRASFEMLNIAKDKLRKVRKDRIDLAAAIGNVKRTVV